MKVDVNKENKVDGMTPLMLALENANEEIIDLLLKAGADVNKGMKGWTPLLKACESGNKNSVKMLIKAGADFNKVTDMKEYSEFYDRDVYNIEDFRNSLFLLNEGYNEEMTAMLYAARGGDEKIVEILIKAGVDVNKGKETDGSTPLMLASENGHHTTVVLLLKNGAVVDKEDRLHGWTALLEACTGAHFEVVEELVKGGADVNKASPEGSTPLLMAVNNSEVEVLLIDVVQFLLNAGADKNKADTDGNTPLSVAVEKGEEDLVKLLNAA